MAEKYADFLLDQFNEFKESNLKLTSRLAQLEAENNSTQTEMRILEKKCFLYKSERDCYRNFIKSYETEINGEKYFDLTKEAFTKLESNLAKYSDLTNSLTSKITSIEYNLGKSNKECLKLKEENEKLNATLEVSVKKEKEISILLDQMKTKYAALEEQLKTLTEEKKSQSNRYSQSSQSSLSSLSSQPSIPSQPSQYSQSDDYRIIHLKNNPVDNRVTYIWQHYKSLVEENVKLNKRLEIIEAGHNADITQRVNDEINYQQDIEHYKLALQQSEKKRNKLIEEFKRTSKEFREVIKCLTGYRIDLMLANTYKVSFIYSENPADYLLFKAENQKVELLETDFSKKLKNFIKVYLEKYDSYPAFLASLSLDIFKKANADQ